MKTQRTNTNAVDTQFDEWAKAVAHGLTRRKILQVLGGGFAGALVALRGSKAWAAPGPGTKGCGHICAPLFNPQNQGAFAACTQACEDCKSCQGTATMTSTQMLVCINATPCRNGGGLACCQSDQNCCDDVCCTGTCCGGTCCPSNMECCGTACVSQGTVCCNGVVCPSGEICCGTTCVSASAVCCGGNVCSSGQTCCGGNCLTPCSAGFTFDSTCQCVSARNSAVYVCNDGTGFRISCTPFTCEELRPFAENSCVEQEQSSLYDIICTPC